MSHRRAIVLIVAVWLLSVLIWLRPGVTRPDGVAYFAYLPSAWFDGDLLLFNEWQHFGMLPNGIIRSEGLTANGHLADHWTAGSAVAWAPAFLLADGIREIVPSMHRFMHDGMSLPYNVAAISASALCGLITLLAGYAAARRLFSIGAATMATIGVWFGSSLLWYSTREALMAHAPSAAACALVVLASMRLAPAELTRSAKRGEGGAERRVRGVRTDDLLAAGVAAGLAFAIRPQNITFLAVPFIVASVRRWGPLLAGFLAGALPQIVVTVVLYGNPLTLFNLSPANPQRPWHAFERFWGWQPLFSWYHGLAAWTPLLLVGILGFPLLFRAHRGLGAAAMLMFLAQWFLNSTADRFFWSGSSFGQRRFDNCTIFFLLGAAAIFAVLPRWMGALVAAAGSLWTMALFFAAGAMDLNRYYTPAELIDAFARAPKAIRLLVSVPIGFQSAVLIVFGAVIALYAVLALLMRARPGAVTTAFCVIVAAFFGFCGLRDTRRMDDWSGVIARNRALEPYSGAVQDRLALLRDEEHYLRATGKTAEADRTRAEITTLEKSVP